MTGPLVQEVDAAHAPRGCDRQRRGLRVIYRLLVAVQFCIVAMTIAILKSPGHGLVSSVVQLIGVALGLSAIQTMRIGRVRATPELAKGAELLRHGPYRYLRHPMYSALLLFTGSYIISDGSWFSTQLWLCLFVVLLTKVHYEEKELRRAFPECLDYASKTSRLIPFVW